MMAVPRSIMNINSLDMVNLEKLIHLGFIWSGHPFLNYKCFCLFVFNIYIYKLIHFVKQFSSYIYWKYGNISSQIIILLQSSRSFKSVFFYSFSLGSMHSALNSPMGNGLEVM